MGRRDHASAFRTAALLLLVIVAFGRITTHEFVNFDDDKFVYANEKLLPPTAATLAQLWREEHAHLYVPVTMTAWWVVAQAGLVRDGTAAGGFALNPWVFHAGSLLVHVANVLLVRRIVRSITRDDLAAVLGAAVFAVHPLQVETVAWASELKDLLAAMFSLLAISALMEAAGSHDPQSAGGGRRRGRAERGTSEAPPRIFPHSRRRTAWWLAAIACFVLAMLSKPSAVTLPVIAAVVAWICRGDACVARGGDAGETRATQASPLRVLIVGIALAAPIALITRYVQPASDVPAPALWARPIVAADAVAFYLGKIVWPVQLTVDYGRTPAAVFASRAAYWTWLVPLAITIVVLLTRKRILIGAWLIFLAAPAANLGLLPFDFQIVSTVADHYVYLGLLAVALALAWAVSNWPTIATPPIAGLLLLLGILSFIQAGRWNDSYALWRHALAVNPNSGLAYGNLGVAYLNGGNANAALSLLIRATAIDPHDPFAQLNLIRAQLAVGQTGAAADSAERLVAAYRRRSDFDPQLVAAVLDRFAAAIAARGDASSAERLRNEAARLRIPQEK